jgi:hypothetical protein
MPVHHPARCLQQLTQLVVIAGVMFAAQTVGADDEISPRSHRVRSESPSIATTILDAIERSATFRSLIETIDATDGLVYVAEGKCGHSVSACLALSVKVVGAYRLLRILVNTHENRCDLMASIGHELRHAIEVLGEPGVTSNARMYLFFQHEGPTNDGRFETEAAVRTGNEVGAQCGRTGR